MAVQNSLSSRTVVRWGAAMCLRAGKHGEEAGEEGNTAVLTRKWMWQTRWNPRQHWVLIRKPFFILCLEKMGIGVDLNP